MVTNRSMPVGVIIPEIPYPDVREAVIWLCRTFDFKERLKIGNHRAQLSLDGESIVVTEQTDGPSASVSVMVRITDLDHHYERVKQSGAEIISPPTDYPYGERQYTVRDLGGHRWTFSQTLADVDPETWGGILFED